MMDSFWWVLFLIILFPAALPGWYLLWLIAADLWRALRTVEDLDE